MGLLRRGFVPAPFCDVSAKLSEFASLRFACLEGIPTDGSERKAASALGDLLPRIRRKHLRSPHRPLVARTGSDFTARSVPPPGVTSLCLEVSPSSSSLRRLFPVFCKSQQCSVTVKEAKRARRSSTLISGAGWLRSLHRRRFP